MAKLTTYNHIAGLNRALKSLPKSASVHLRDSSAVIADKVARKAQGLAYQLGGVLRLVAPSIKASRDRVPVIKMGGSAKLPTQGGSWSHSRSSGRQAVGDIMWGAEFGGGRRETTHQFQPWRGSGEGAGYAVWPTVEAERDTIHDEYSQGLLEALKDI